MYNTKLTPSRKVAPQFMGYIAALLYVVEAVLFAFTVYYIFNADYIYSLIVVGLFVAVFAGLFVCSKHFSWYLSGEIFISDRDIKYEVLGILDMMGNRKTVYKIHEITRVERRGSSLVIYGNDCSVKEPVGKLKSCRKVIVEDCTEEVEQRIKNLI